MLKPKMAQYTLFVCTLFIMYFHYAYLSDQFIQLLSHAAAAVYLCYCNIVAVHQFSKFSDNRYSSICNK